ncbi:MAG: tRNA (adenosine(37)-N6)-dimethylallyltransferase MiaA [Lachnospiraceae bacterium]|nr:tRNA (adenosine(37)-N6)-dimethylallyltransferase MiaA [Lachnospiraceae bacterium]
MIKPLVVIAGPTAVGKSDLAVNIAKIIGGEIISADSMQIYKYMDIGTAKVTEEEKSGIRHHLIDVLNPDCSFDALSFKNLAIKAIDDILSRDHIPIICGGTGFYIQAVTKDIDFTEEDNTEIRKEIEDFYDKEGMDALFERLRSVDPESCGIIPKQNIKRVIRAIEFHEIHGIKISDHNKIQQKNKTPYNLAYFVIERNREDLYADIDRRVDIMIENGLLEEVRNITSKFEFDERAGIYNAIGYREILGYLNNEYSFERAVELIKQNSRHYAKRQFTFFKREKDAIWLSRDNMSKEMIIESILKVLREKHIYE